MTLQQLRYMICVAERASLGDAANALHVSQPALSMSIRDLESETGSQLFERTTRGMSLTLDGVEFLSYARQVIEQVGLLERKFLQKDSEFRKFSISTQHYTFVVDAFVDFARKFKSHPYIFNFRETTTSGIIEDVAKNYSELGILFCSTYNEGIMRNVFHNHNLTFSDIVWLAPHVFLAASHPLAGRKCLKVEDLEEFPCVTYDRGRGSSLYYAEEVLSDRSLRQNIRVTDRDSAANFILGANAYYIGTGIFTSRVGAGIVAVPLDVQEYIRVVAIQRAGQTLSPLGQAFMAELDLGIRRLRRERPDSCVEPLPGA